MKNLQIHINVSADTYLKDPNTSVLGRKIVSASIEMIDELGFEAFTFKKLGQKIASPESSIYRYFESKHMLLIYITNWYWSWIEYKIVFAISNIKSPKTKLKKAIKILTQTIKEDTAIAHINEVLLDRIIVCEGMKSYYVKEIDEENQKGYFEVYKRIVQRLSEFVLEIKPKFEFPHMLISTVIEGAHQQKYFKAHLPALTDVKKGRDNISKFYTLLVFKLIEA
ncbi:MAG TPA: TetR/AcrR family transcriptional regulator [Saprospiraceae bacterium]|nr:TetR/AcrR family transcriptional regulator [Saprospiraceae bacterium]